MIDRGNATNPEGLSAYRALRKCGDGWHSPHQISLQLDTRGKNRGLLQRQLYQLEMEGHVVRRPNPHNKRRVQWALRKGNMQSTKLPKRFKR